MSGADRWTPSVLDEHQRQLERDGITVLRGLFDPELVRRWSRAFDALFQERKARPGGLAPREKERFYLTFPWRAPFADPGVFAHPVLMAFLGRVFPQEFRMVQLAADIPCPGSEYQELHRDYRPLFTDQLVTPLYALAVNFPLVDVTPENGPLDMVRGTHRMPRDEGLARAAAGELAVESFPMKLGDVAVRTPLALHRGTPNRSAKPRPMVVMGYVMHWLHTPKVDLTVPRAVFESYTAPVRQLLRCRLVDELPADATESYIEFQY